MEQAAAGFVTRLCVRASWRWPSGVGITARFIVRLLRWSNTSVSRTWPTEDCWCRASGSEVCPGHPGALCGPGGWDGVRGPWCGVLMGHAAAAVGYAVTLCCPLGATATFAAQIAGRPAHSWLRCWRRPGLAGSACVRASRHASRRCSPRPSVWLTRFGERVTALVSCETSAGPAQPTYDAVRRLSVDGSPILSVFTV